MKLESSRFISNVNGELNINTVFLILETVRANQPRLTNYTFHSQTKIIINNSRKKKYNVKNFSE